MGWLSDWAAGYADRLGGGPHSDWVSTIDHESPTYKRWVDHINGGRHMDKLTQADLEAEIVWEATFTANHALFALSEAGREAVGSYINTKGALPPGNRLALMTICLLVTRNGFTLVGTSCPINAENFSFEVGEREARKAAIEQLWPLLGYSRREGLIASGKTALAARLAPGGDLHPQPVPGVYGSDDKEG